MAEIKLEDIKSIAMDVMGENQNSFKASDPSEILLYTLAYNDGVFDLLEEIESRLFPTIKRFDPKEAADDREKNEHL